MWRSEVFTAEGTLEMCKIPALSLLHKCALNGD